MDKRWSELADSLTGVRMPDALSDDDTIEVAEKILGAPLTAENIGQLDKGLLAKLDAYNARKALAEYMLRSNLTGTWANNRWTIPRTAKEIAMLSVTDPKSPMYREFLSTQDDVKKDILKRVMEEVPDELYSEDDANDFKWDKREANLKKAVKEAEAAGDENPYSVFHSNSADAADFKRKLHEWDDKRNEPLVTDEEREALIGDMPEDNVREYYRRMPENDGLLNSEEMTALGELAKSIMETEVGGRYNDNAHPSAFAMIDFGPDDWSRHHSHNADYIYEDDE